MEKCFIDDLKDLCSSVNENVILAEHTTFKVGGPCAAMAIPETVSELRVTVLFCKKNNIPYFVLGKGSNVLVADSGYDGVVIKPGGEFLNISFDEESESITAGAACSLTALSLFACERGLSGFEFASGIPGSVGGGVRMNAGAYGGEIVQIIVDCTFLDGDGEIKTVSSEELMLSYRHSIFCERPDCIVLSARFKGTCKANPADIKSAMVELNRRRKDKQPLEFPSAGSTFKRPEGYFAAKLIEDAGLKGYTCGNASVSSKHSGFVVNLGGATCDDIVNVIRHVKNEVYKQFNVVLETEIIILGDVII